MTLEDWQGLKGLHGLEGEGFQGLKGLTPLSRCIAGTLEVEGFETVQFIHLVLKLILLVVLQHDC